MILLTFFRSGLFNIFFPLWTLVVSVGCFPFVLFSARSAGWVGRIWARGALMGVRLICGITYEIQGREHLPSGAYVVASKHQSAWDTIIFLLILDDPAFVLKQELTKLPFFGPYLKRMKMIAIDRSGKATALKAMVHQAEERLAQGRPVVIFPEGTRSAVGENRQYHPGIAAIYNHPAMQSPVVPVALNSGLYWGKSAFLKKPGKITLEFLPPIYPGMDRKAFMSALHEQIEAASARLLG